jgi:hypothetical protein
MEGLGRPHSQDAGMTAQESRWLRCQLKLESRRQLQPSRWQRRHGLPEEMRLEVAHVGNVIDVVKHVERLEAEGGHFALFPLRFAEIKIARQPQV